MCMSVYVFVHMFVEARGWVGYIPKLFHLVFWSRISYELADSVSGSPSVLASQPWGYRSALLPQVLMSAGDLNLGSYTRKEHFITTVTSYGLMTTS